MKSKIYKEEKVENKERKFGSQLEYFPCMVIDKDGNEIAALFTENQINVAVERAKRNIEDIPQNDKSFFDWLLGK